MENRRCFFTLFLTVFLMTFGMLIGQVVGQANCPNGDNYGPCTCTYADGGYVIDCYEVLVEDVASVFKRTTPQSLKTFNFSLSASDVSVPDGVITVPADLLHEHQVYEDIRLSCPSRTNKLVVEPDAFLFSKNFTMDLHLESCDTHGLNFDFLTGFNELSSLTLSSASNVQLADWASLPSLRKLAVLNIYQSTDLNGWTAFPPLTRGLRFLLLQENQIQDAAMDRILIWALGHSANTLQFLSILYNDLTSVPVQIPSFKRLHTLDIRQQKSGIPLITSGSLSFSAPVGLSYIFSASNQIATIEPGAFHGDFSNAFVDLSLNNLTRFEELVFKETLQQMTNSTQSMGQLHTSANPFDCESDPCHLAWLIRDNRHMLERLLAGCSNGTSFSDLDSNAFGSCPTPP